MSAPPDLLGAFAALAAERADVAGGAGLHQPRAAFVLANAVWRPAPDRLDEARAWCRERALPEAVVLDAGDAAALALARAAGLTRRTPFELAPAPEGAGTPPDGAPLVEQAPWALAEAAGRLLAARYRLPAFAPGIATTLAEAMQRDARLRLRLAYPPPGAGGDAPIGALLALADAVADGGAGTHVGLLEAGGAAALRALHAAASTEARAEGLEPLRLVARAAGAAPARGVVRLEAP